MSDIEDKLALATTALVDLHKDWPHEEIGSVDGGAGLAHLLTELVTTLRGMGVDDDGGWDCAETVDIPVAGVVTPVDGDIDDLAVATTALRDIHMGYPDDQIVALDGLHGLGNLIHGLVAKLRGRGYNDDGGWNLDASDEAPDAAPAV